MQKQLISHSPDLKRLRDEGYEIEIKGGYICIHHIPYLNKNSEIKFGTLISELNISGEKAGAPSTHAIHFMGEEPCHKDGSVMVEIINSGPNQSLGEGLIGNQYFSSKPEETGIYLNYYDKFKRYMDLLSIPARSVDPSITASTHKPYDDDPDGVFQYFDSNASRANISQLNEMFKDQKIGIIGLGGTGSYILDFVAKTPVKEIHLFDADDFSQHNAFRSPGAVSLSRLKEIPKKSEYFAEIYSNMHKKIIPHVEYVTSENIGKLKDLTYVFICVDKNSVRNSIINGLLSLGITFIDVGLGVDVQDGKLVGIIRTTCGSPSKHDHLIKRLSAEDTDDNDYATNIQIADLNAMNACKAVEKWKKMTGFYLDEENEFHSSYTINASLLINADN